MTAAVALVAAAVTAAVSTPQPAPIQQQGDSPYCLFAVAGYLHDLDMWRLAADYYRANLPTEADGVTPQNGPLLDWLAHIGHESHVYPRWADAEMLDDVRSGQPVAASIGRGQPQQHAIVLVALRDDVLWYVDPARPGVWWMTLDAFWQTQTGWYWRRK